MNENIIPTSESTRLRICRWDAASGRSLVSIKPEYRDRRGMWRLAHSAVSVPLADAPQLAAAVLQVAASIDGGPVDPMPAQADCDESRRP